MPRRIKEVKILAVNDGKNPIKYLTEGGATWWSPDEFIRCMLAEPHQEKYNIRYVAHDSYEPCRPWMPYVSEEEFSSMVQYMAKFNHCHYYDPEIYMKYFDVLWEGGLLSPC